MHKCTHTRVRCESRLAHQRSYANQNAPAAQCAGSCMTAIVCLPKDRLWNTIISAKLQNFPGEACTQNPLQKVHIVHFFFVPTRPMLTRFHCSCIAQKDVKILDFFHHHSVTIMGCSGCSTSPCRKLRKRWGELIQSLKTSRSAGSSG